MKIALEFYDKWQLNYIGSTVKILEVGKVGSVSAIILLLFTVNSHSPK